VRRPPTPIVREVTPQEYALRQYAVAYDRLEDRERQFIEAGRLDLALGARILADRVLAAYQSELTA
jgi:hypothetical protein